MTTSVEFTSGGKTYYARPPHMRTLDGAEVGDTPVFSYWSSRNGRPFGPVRMASASAKSSLYRDGMAAWEASS